MQMMDRCALYHQPMIKRLRQWGQSRWIRYGLALVVGGMVVFFLALVLLPLPKEKLHPKEAYRFYDRNDELIAVLISEDGFFRMHVPFEQISPLLIRTVLMQEDKYFPYHVGINPISIIQAAVTNLRAGRIVSGGSTITMQLARMLERHPRTLGAKLIETFRALQIELRYSKEEILAFYFALAPYGGNLEGVQAASYYYFGRSASQLSTGEIALLVALPKAPNQLRPDRNPEQARRARDQVLRNMLEHNLIDSEQFKRAQLEAVPLRRWRTVNLIPHTAWYLRQSDPQRYVWKTTIDSVVQARAHNLLKRHFEGFRVFNITNGAVVVIDNKAREIRAIVGSLNYLSEEALGANDGARAPRSPGSTLKPFLYGIAFDLGYISEYTTLYDIPINYGGYAPQNYAKNFTGPVSAHEALTESLNVVAVRLSKEIGQEKLYNLIKDGGITTLDRPVEYYGLPLVLGGVEIPLVELTNLFASLANDGVYAPVRLLREANHYDESAQKRLLSSEATWLVTHILTDVERPDFPQSWEYTKDRPTIAWKTGTSYANQDAWSLGYTPTYTIGVWLGNFDGSPSKGLVGHDAAAPLLFDLLQAIDAQDIKRWFPKPPGVKRRKVCAISGRIPNRNCPRTIEEYYISTVTGPIHTEPCPIHQEITFTEHSPDHTSSEPEKKTTKVFEVWPPEIATFMLKHGVPVRQVPPYDLRHMAGDLYYPPKILSPVPHAVYYKRFDRVDPKHHGIKLSVAVTNRVRRVFWFLNDKLIADIDPIEDVLINPNPGRHRIKVIDDVGGSDEMELVVENYQVSSVAY